MSKLNWGHGITIFYVIFVGTLLTVLIASFGVDHSLVVDDYYAKDLDYQNHYNKSVNNLNNDHLNISYGDGIVGLDFNNDTEYKGTVHFYRPSDKSLDFVVAINANNLRIPTSHLPVGRWKIKVDWTADGKSYYKEQEFYF